jgi:hypothetical protein
MRWDARWFRLDCRVAALLAMTTEETGMGGVVRHGFRMPGPVLSLRGRSRRELTWQSSLRRDAGCRGDAVGCPMVPTGLPRRCAPRNDNGGNGGSGVAGDAGSSQVFGRIPLRCHCEPV